MDLGDWCEVTYENEVGAFISLDCYKLGTLDPVYLENFLADYEKPQKRYQSKAKKLRYIKVRMINSIFSHGKMIRIRHSACLAAIFL